MTTHPFRDIPDITTKRWQHFCRDDHLWHKLHWQWQILCVLQLHVRRPSFCRVCHPHLLHWGWAVPCWPHCQPWDSAGARPGSDQFSWLQRPVGTNPYAQTEGFHCAAGLRRDSCNIKSNEIQNTANGEKGGTEAETEEEEEEEKEKEDKEEEEEETPREREKA